MYSDKLLILRKFVKYFLTLMMVMFTGSWLLVASAEEANYLLGPGDVLKIAVYNNPDLTLETRISEAGKVSFPLIGEVELAGITSSGAEKKIADLLESGGFVKQPQINILVVQFQSKMVSVLGSVYKPGRYPLDRATNLVDLLALVGGATQDGSDIVTIVGKSGKAEYDLHNIVFKGDGVQNVQLKGGEIVYVHARDVSVMGQVNRPGKYAVVGGVRTVADFLSVAGGANPSGSDTATVTTVRDGKINRFEVDIDSLFRTGDNDLNVPLMSGDSIYVPRAPMVYIYGEVQRPGSFRLERNMTVIQALAQGGGPTARGSQRNIKLHRRNVDGVIEKLSPAMTDALKQDDVLYVQESLF
ncbi:SLBB domain-containing protein [Methylotenera sp. L2L1]|uniref:SLBB domain-containing protein n=1 Tax=Methylotenera sp. L2L1 TaxID=1502770 RepID=UPI000AF732C0|nr:SLBB domain-containing protein [Methylotenera sp. L2L1]